VSASFWEVQRANVLRTWFLFFVLVGLYFGAGFLIDYLVSLSNETPITPFFTSIALFAAILHGLIGFAGGPGLILGGMNARPADPEDPLEKVLIDVVKEMAVASGLPVPSVYVVETLVPNAFATGVSPENSYVVATKGLLGLLDREELQGVVAHEMGHIRNRDVLTVTTAIIFSGAMSMLADWMLIFIT
jgi:heat shock protein HtpX